MNKKETIEIMQVDNGYLVKPVVGRDRDMCIDGSSFTVFQSLEELKNFLDSHFSFRRMSILPDFTDEK